jgi:Mor family transcriptional regulator
MSEKCKSDEDTCIHSGKKRSIITMDTKVEIIKQHEKGNKFVDTARAYKMNESTVRTIIRDKV